MRLYPKGSQEYYNRAYDRNDKRKLINKEKYEGQIFKSNHGKEFVIKEYLGIHNVICEYLFSGVIREYRLKNIENGCIQDPFYRQNGDHKPFVFVNPEDEYLGRIFTNSQGDKFKIIEYRKYKDITIQFLDHPYYTTTTSYSNAKKGAIDNPYHINEFGGFLGEDREFRGLAYKTIYGVWHGILTRLSEKKRDQNPSYNNCIMDPNWKNYSIFARDYMNKLSQLNPDIKYNIDKDLLYPFYKDKTNGMKCYSNETTVLLPEDINRDFLNINPIIYNDFNRFCYIIDILESYWKDRFIYYLNIGGLSLDNYNILEQLRIEKINTIKSINSNMTQKLYS